jgi:rhodanese-related sulfurtransferase
LKKILTILKKIINMKYQIFTFLFVLCFHLSYSQNKGKRDVGRDSKALSILQAVKQDSTYLIIDISDPEDYKEGHIKNAISLYAIDFQEKIDKYDKNKNALLYHKRYHRKAVSTYFGMVESMGFDKARLHTLDFDDCVKVGFEIVK